MIGETIYMHIDISELLGETSALVVSAVISEDGGDNGLSKGSTVLDLIGTFTASWVR